MRKSDNNRTGGSGRGKPSRSGEGRSSERKQGSGSYSDRPKKRSDASFAGRKEKSGERDSRPRRSSSDKEEGPSRRKEFTPGGSTRRPSGDASERKPRRSSDESADRKPRRSFSDKDERKPRRKEFTPGENTRRPSGESSGRTSSRSFMDRDKASSFSERRKSGDRDKKPHRKEGRTDEKRDRKPESSTGEKPFSKYRDKPDVKIADKSEKPFKARGEDRKFKKEKDGDKSIRRVKYDDFEDGKSFSGPSAKGNSSTKKVFKKQGASLKPQVGDGLVRLNKYLANAGIASRREADTLIQGGTVKVNGVVVDQLGYKISPGDKVTYGDAAVRSEHKVYLLLNKPKDYITTVDDPQERKTVMELVAKACKERIYPVGRLDRNTTGLLLFTNDGDLTTKLMHPKYSIKKVYHVSLNKGLKPEDFKAITEGIELEDGVIKADDLAFVGEGKKEIGIEIHSGRNRIVRRIFEHLGYDVVKLDRVAFAGLTKKDLSRGKYRFLTAKEIGFLQMIG